MVTVTRNRVRLGAIVAIASALGVILIVSSSPSGAGAGSASLEPDLVTLPLGEQHLAMRLDGSSTLLRFSNEIGNLGAGPLEIAPSAVSNDCDGDADPANDRDATQRVYEDADGSGGFEAGSDPVASEHRFGCMRYHLAHDHWHVLDIARYALRHEPSGKLAARTRKVGFCLADFRHAFPAPSSRRSRSIRSSPPTGPPNAAAKPPTPRGSPRAGPTSTGSTSPGSSSTSAASSAAATA